MSWPKVHFDWNKNIPPFNIATMWLNNVMNFDSMWLFCCAVPVMMYSNFTPIPYCFQSLPNSSFSPALFQWKVLMVIVLEWAYVPRAHHWAHYGVDVVKKQWMHKWDNPWFLNMDYSQNSFWALRAKVHK